MADDTLVTPVKIETLRPVAAVYPGLYVQQGLREPNKFLKVLDGVAGNALNFVAPGLGEILGNLIRSSGSSFGSYSALMEQLSRFEETQRCRRISSARLARRRNQMMNRQHSMRLVNVRHRVGRQEQQLTTVSNLMRTRHDSEMAAVNNIKS